MSRIRPELTKGVAVLGLFLILVVTTSYLQPHSLPISEYTFVDLERVSQNPLPFDNFNISSTVTVDTVFYSRPDYHIITDEGFDLQIRYNIAEPPPEIAPGDRIFIRGTIRVFNESIFSVRLHEFYVLDYSSSIIRSIPGIFLFIVMFFMIFRVDFSRLAFMSRKGGTESA